jgi:hypothetical protein
MRITPYLMKRNVLKGTLLRDPLSQMVSGYLKFTGEE